MKLSYKQRLSFYFFIIFALFTFGIIIFEQSREKKFRTEALTEKLDAYTEIIHASLKKHPTLLQSMDSISLLLPENLRLTLINRQGEVIYDNSVATSLLSENHAKRHEVATANTQGRGFDIRTSTSNNQKYLYYAKRSNDYFIRVAFPYDIQIQDFLKSDNLFLFYILILFIFILLLINYVADRFGKSIKRLKEFALSGANTKIQFPEDELGEIGRKIIDNYEQLQESKRELSLQREKLLQHVHSSGEGLCFFSSDKKPGFYNGLFIQYMNIITDDALSDPSFIFTDPAFADITDFLSHAIADENYYETQIKKQGKHFHIYVNMFEDSSFGIIINDITQQEKMRLLKQEMTSNIAHELRTPVTSIRGYLEIALGQALNGEKAHDFLSKAHEQTLVLSELIQDMSLITKMEEASTSFKKEAIHIEKVIHTLQNDLKELLVEKNIKIECINIHDVVVSGNRNLLYSLFRNLSDNAIRYAGCDISIIINKYKEDKDFYYFSYADTGVGIADEHHLNRLFERFYRVNEGRTRDTGGSGLGLSIVKNAVLFHKGTIVVKNRVEGGLEFLFKLQKNKED